MKNPMDIKSIEAKDKEYRDKLKKIRKNLALRRVLADRKESHPKVNFKVLIPVLMISFLMLYLVGKLISGYQSDKPTLQTNSISEPKSPEIPEAKELQIISEKTGTAETSYPSDVLYVDHEHEAANPETPIVLSDKEEEMEPDEPPLTENPEPKKTLDSASVYGTRIAGYLVCSGVIGRNCSSSRSVFDLNENQSPHLWMKVYSDSIPYKLKHVYYREGQKYVEVPLKIEYRTMRTWSSIRLVNSTFIGSWHVDIEDEYGNVLGSANFRVTSGN